MHRALGWSIPAMFLAGCTMPPFETPAEALARRQVSCTEAGFSEGTPDFRLCLLLQQTNERLEAVERRLIWIEQDTSWRGPYIGPGWW
jgi:hypothetical protein